MTALLLGSQSRAVTRSGLEEIIMRKLLLCASYLCACLALSTFNAVAQTKDCKTISDSLERLKCFDGQTAGAPSAAPAAPAAPAPEPFLPALTTQILKTEPPIGQLAPSAKVLIDDGTCPAGQLKQVVGGIVATGQPRLRSCVPRP